MWMNVQAALQHKILQTGDLLLACKGWVQVIILYFEMKGSDMSVKQKVFQYEQDQPELLFSVSNSKIHIHYLQLQILKQKQVNGNPILRLISVHNARKLCISHQRKSCDTRSNISKVRGGFLIQDPVILVFIRYADPL
jgi:predicted O-linked N-acetylglucosamine transferase (SPINDLY family)